MSCYFCAVSCHIPAAIDMRSPVANQTRRSTRGRRFRQPTTPPNRRSRIEYEPKVKYALSKRTADGVLVLCSRKRAPPTAEERAAKKAKQLEIKTKQVSLVVLRHKVISIWQHGMCIVPNFVFGPRKRTKIFCFEYFPIFRILLIPWVGHSPYKGEQ